MRATFTKEYQSPVASPATRLSAVGHVDRADRSKVFGGSALRRNSVGVSRVTAECPMLRAEAWRGENWVAGRWYLVALV
jgi:hypothetical protein